MIAHLSVPSETPRETALFFAAVIDGLAFDFPVVPGASIAVARDGSGTAVEVYPPSMKHHPGEGEVDPDMMPDGPQAMPWEDQIFAEPGGAKPSSFHLAITTQLTEAEIQSRAQALGWRTLACERAGVFGVVEVWVDNRYLVEVLVPNQAARYRAFMNIEDCSAMFGPGVAP